MVVLGFGALLEGGGVVTFGYSYSGAALLGGLDLRPLRGFRCGLFGEFGRHSYSDIGRDFIDFGGGDPGAWGSTAYAGSRVMISGIPGKKRGHLEVGAYADFQDDLTRTRTRFYYSDGTANEHVIGMWRFSYGIELGGAVDVF